MLFTTEPSLQLQEGFCFDTDKEGEGKRRGRESGGGDGKLGRAVNRLESDGVSGNSL